jgi:hypothetical protein
MRGGRGRPPDQRYLVTPAWELFRAVHNYVITDQGVPLRWDLKGIEIAMDRRGIPDPDYDPDYCVELLLSIENEYINMLSAKLKKDLDQARAKRRQRNR